MSEQPQEPIHGITQVTKVRNAGRVAAGHQLQEWNRKNKENLLKNKVEEPASSSDKSSQEPTSSSTKSYDGYFDGMGTIVVMLAIGCVVYFQKQKKPTPSSQPKPQTSPAAESKRGVFEME